MKNPLNQNQHKLPQVYIREFGYKYNTQWKVSVMKVGEKFVRQKSIESFLSETNIFKINNSYENLENIFENLNGMIENEYLNVINDLESQRKFTKKSCFLIFQIIPNLLCRADSIRNLVKEILNSDSKINFIKMICFDSYSKIQDLESQKFFNVMINETLNDGLINKVLIFLSKYLQLRLMHYEIVILKSQDERTWCTTDNPIVFENKWSKFDLMTVDSEIYFPLNPKFLIYLYNKESMDKFNKLRTLQTNIIHEVDDNEIVELQQKIISNAFEYIIFDGEFKYTIE